MGSARDTTVTGLTHDTEHVFQVRAHNAEGDGRADSVRATPLACAATVVQVRTASLCGSGRRRTV